MDTNGWDEYKRLVLTELERCSKRLDNIDERLSNIELTFAKLQTRLYTGAVLIAFVITTVMNFIEDMI
jgi:hypothetical protein